ncbi:MAG: hypothetical protein KFW09_01820 [Oscillospiraceae bacterium]|nr:hypothetical protein [Oscillospiraceae bacterium]
MNLNPYTSNSKPEEDIVKINKFSRRQLSIDEVYIFPLILCDNDIDRDFEAFSLASLKTISSIFIGKTGILDHDNSSSNQTARIFKTSVISDSKKTTSFGDTYKYILAHAYMVRSKKNEDVILDIDAGIKKEVSVGCSVSNKDCSICSINKKSLHCSHIGGNFYGNSVCYSILNNVIDGYEWSFVAVPSQINAGVIKSFNSSNHSTENISSIIKSIKNSSESSLSSSQTSSLLKYIDNIQHIADIGLKHCDSIKSDIIRLAFINKSTINSSILKQILEKLSFDELTEFKKIFQTPDTSNASILHPSTSPLSISCIKSSDKEFLI